MKRIYMILCVILLLALLGVGIVSLFDKDPTFSTVESRGLKSFPKITVSGIMDGSFVEDLREYYADTFPGREDLAESYADLSKFYFFGCSGEEEEPSGS